MNCPFYFKIGACRHGDRCSRLHNKPTFSQTILLSNMYQQPAELLDPSGGLKEGVDEKDVRKHFEDFYEDVFMEMCEFGEITEMCIAGNLGDHLLGNTYVQFKEEEQAEKALQSMAGRFYAGRPLLIEFSPVTDFREARCRSYDEATCNRGGHCNFLHLMPVSRKLMRRLYEHQKKKWGRKKKRKGGGDPDADRSVRADSEERRKLIAAWSEGGGADRGRSPRRSRSRSGSSSRSRSR